jgi:hypothetical protein
LKQAYARGSHGQQPIVDMMHGFGKGIDHVLPNTVDILEAEVEQQVQFLLKQANNTVRTRYFWLPSSY